jgi:hypothetical protein
LANVGLQTPGLFVWAGCGWLWLAVLLCRESCCAEKAAVLSFTVWLFGWLFGCKLGIVLNNLNVTRR